MTQHFEIEDDLGTAPLDHVWRGRDRLSGTRVTVKKIPPDLLATGTATAMSDQFLLGAMLGRLAGSIRIPFRGCRTSLSGQPGRILKNVSRTSLRCWMHWDRYLRLPHRPPGTGDRVVLFNQQSGPHRVIVLRMTLTMNLRWWPRTCMR